MTVQGALEEALATLIRRPVRLTVAGRTDAGVHARGQVAHFDVAVQEWAALNRGREIAPGDALRRRLRGVLGKVLEDRAGAIVVHHAASAPGGFDARFSALWRRYSYRIADRPALWDPLARGYTLWYKDNLAVDRLNEAAAQLLGLQDFLAFCKPRPGATTIRELQQLSFTRGADGIIGVTIQADAFCHNMVRALIGASLRVGSGERDVAWIRGRLLARMRDSDAGLAPPHPLVLEEVRYPDDDALLTRADQTRAVRDGY